jgi:hypothetical protein
LQKEKKKKTKHKWIHMDVHNRESLHSVGVNVFQSLWETVLRFLKKIERLYDLTTPFLGI